MNLQGAIPRQLYDLNLEEMLEKENEDDDKSNRQRHTWPERLRKNYTITHPRVHRPNDVAALEQALEWPFNITAVLVYPVSSEVS